MGELYILSPLSFLCHVPSSIQLGIPDEFLTRDRAHLASQLSPLSPPFIAQIPIVKRINFPQVTLINSSQLQFQYLLS